jgi:hypothetical protein
MLIDLGSFEPIAALDIRDEGSEANKRQISALMTG